MSGSVIVKDQNGGEPTPTPHADADAHTDGDTRAPA